MTARNILIGGLLAAGLSGCTGEELTYRQQEIDVIPEEGLGTLRITLPELSAYPGLAVNGMGAPSIDDRGAELNRSYSLRAGEHCVSVPHSWPSAPSVQNRTTFRGCGVAVRSNQETHLVLGGLRLQWDPAVTAVDVGMRAQLQLGQPGNDRPLMLELDGAGFGRDRIYLLPPGAYTVRHIVPGGTDFFGEPVTIQVPAGQVTTVDVTPADRRTRLELTRQDTPPRFAPASGNRVELFATARASGYSSSRVALEPQAATRRFHFFATTATHGFLLQVNGISETLEPRPAQPLARTLQVINVFDFASQMAGSFTVEYQSGTEWRSFLERNPTSRSFDALPQQRYRIRTYLRDGLGTEALEDEQILSL